MSRNRLTCRCKAYPFPHRFGGGDCVRNEIPYPRAEDRDYEEYLRQCRRTLRRYREAQQAALRG